MFNNTKYCIIIEKIFDILQLYNFIEKFLLILLFILLFT